MPRRWSRSPSPSRASCARSSPSCVRWRATRGPRCATCRGRSGRRGADNDLIELTQAAEPLRDIAVSPAPRDGRVRDGALPATTKALSVATPELATARPYAPDLAGWFDDFSHSGLYDALGGASRAGLYVNLFANVNGVLKPLLDQTTASKALEQGLSSGQRWRCPGAAERGAIYKPSPDFPCDASEGPLGK